MFHLRGLQRFDESPEREMRSRIRSRRTPTMCATRRSVLAAGAAAAASAVVPPIFAQQSGQNGTGNFYDKGDVHIYYEEAGSGFP